MIPRMLARFFFIGLIKKQIHYPWKLPGFRSSVTSTNLSDIYIKSFKTLELQTNGLEIEEDKVVQVVAKSNQV